MILPILLVYALTRAFWWITTHPVYLSSPQGLAGPLWMDGLIKALLWVLPCVIALKLLRRETWHDAWGELGLTRLEWRGTALMLAATLPMVALALTAAFTRLHPGSILSFVVLGPIAEEVLYRGFLFQQLVQRARWPGWAAALGSGVVFALAHHRNLDETLIVGFLEQDLATPITMLGPPLLAALAGGCLFAWITWRWRSLWPAIALHGAINFWWDVSIRPDATAAGAAQAAALLAAVVITLAGTAHRGLRTRP